jgi:hypothetical protein
LPVCPKCGKLISEGHYERHVRRCGTIREEEPRLPSQSVTRLLERAERGTGPPREEAQVGRNWKKILVAGFVVFLLIGTLAAFFILYGLSLL